MCLICGKESRSRFCMKCRANIPTDFSRKRPVEEVLTEYKRNERLKKQFSLDRKLGRLELDFLNGIFHFGNIYRSVTELEDYSFFTDTPKFEVMLWRRNVTESIFFVYRLRNGIKNTVKIDNVICAYRDNGKYAAVEPPLKLFGYKQQFAELVQFTKEKLTAKLKDYI